MNRHSSRSPTHKQHASWTGIAHRPPQEAMTACGWMRVPLASQIHALVKVGGLSFALAAWTRREVNSAAFEDGYQ